MLGFLYLITNEANGKQYVGKTYDSVKNRWRDHVKKSKTNINRPLYRAIAKYGVDSFSVEQIDELEEGLLELAEEQLIAELGTFGKGYNATKGGDGRRYLAFSDKEAIDLYLKLKDVRKVASELRSSKETINLIINRNNVERFADTHTKAMTKACGKRIQLIDTGEIYDSMSDCAREIIAAGLSNSSVKTISNNIGRVINGSRNSYLGMKFRCVN